MLAIQYIDSINAENFLPGSCPCLNTTLMFLFSSLPEDCDILTKHKLISWHCHLCTTTSHVESEFNFVKKHEDHGLCSGEDAVSRGRCIWLPKITVVAVGKAESSIWCWWPKLCVYPSGNRDTSSGDKSVVWFEDCSGLDLQV